LKKIELPPRAIETLFGVHDQNIKYLESLLDVRLDARGQDLTVDGDPRDVETVERILEDFADLFREGKAFTDRELREAFAQIAEDRAYSLRDYFTKARFNPAGKKQVAPKSATQRRYIESIQANDCVFGIGPAGTGKCVAADTLVLTDRGMIEIGEIGAGVAEDGYAPVNFKVHGLDGAEAASHVYHGGVAETMKVTTRLGFSVEATPEHPLLSLCPDGELRWKRADELRAGDVLALQRGQRMFGDRAGVSFEYEPASSSDHTSKPVALTELDEPLAYVLGALTGDGCLTFRNRVILSSADETVVGAFKEMASRFGLHVFRNGGGRPYDYIVASAQLYQLLARLGLSTGKAATKRVPRAVLEAPETIVASYLRGLFDADGTVEKRDGLVSLSSVSEKLIAQVQVILLNFGVLAARSVKRGRYRGQLHVSHLLTMAGAEAERFHELIGFALERKRSRRQTKSPNPNVDVIPHVGPRLGAAVRESVFTRAEHRRFYDYSTGRRRPSYAKLGQLVGLLDSHGVGGAALSSLRDLLDGRLLFLEVASVEHSRARVFDLTAPGTHSFVAGGFVNHNTYLAVAMAVQALTQKQVSRIILARPAVEAGERLGFLPGDLQEKVDPYLRPLYDALFDLIEAERVTKMLEKRIIEVAPLAFMRGRAQPLESRVLTPTGWRAMGSLKPGDSVIGSDGRAARVTGVFPQGPKQVYRLTMTDGASTLACAEHLWAVSTPEDKRDGKPPRVLETREMFDRLRRCHQHRYELPLLSAPVEWPRREVPLDPYALGLLIGDGCITDRTSPSFSTSDGELVSSLQLALSGMPLSFRRKSAIDHVIVNPAAGRGGLIVRNPLTQALRGLELAGTRSSTKFIPEEYLHNSAEVRHAVLQGLLDTDGGPVTQPGRTCRVQYTTTSERLKEDVLFLVRSLGGVAYWRRRRAEGRKPGLAKGRAVPYCNDAYVMDIRLPRGVEPFRLTRKAALYREHGGGRPMRFVKSIEPAGVRETQCISVVAADSLYVTDDFILTHNTLSEAFIILDEAQNTTSEQMKMFLTRIGFGSKAVITGDVTQIDLPTGKRSGLIEAQRVLAGVEGIDFVYFTEKDVVRHRLVQLIVKAYEAHTNKSTI
jgi:phosphate starvation-inducible protein PhoH and related proteins